MKFTVSLAHIITSASIIGMFALAIEAKPAVMTLLVLYVTVALFTGVAMGKDNNG